MPTEDDEQGYKYAGFNLTPTAFAELAVQLASGMALRRSELISLVVRHHQSHGGAPITTNPVSIAKKALVTLELKGLASTTVSHGVWSIAGGVPAASVYEAPDPTEPTSEFLYVYYLNTYRQTAESQGLTRWPHKIGMTTATVASRVAAQVGTALPERPIVVIIAESTNAALLERAVHSVLELRGKRIRAAPGNEWFVTGAEELEELLAYCDHPAAYALPPEPEA